MLLNTPIVGIVLSNNITIWQINVRLRTDVIKCVSYAHTYDIHGYNYLVDLI